MKNFILYVIIFALGAFLILKMCEEPPEIPYNSEEMEKITDSLKARDIRIAILEAENDSLKKIPDKIDRQIVYREREIDEAIAEDSSNSLVEYRRSLQDNNYLPDGTLYLTYREVGLGAKLMAKVPKLELKVKTYEEIVFNDEIIISDLKYQIGGYKDLNELQEESIEYYRQLYEDEASFWNSNYLWLGIGVVGASLAVFLAGGLQ